ncbi:MAG TPA: phosphatase PAP2 family protein [Vicinamibacterales bacterium]|jgi:hypothetical protein|nr:phosphatase PAP2 family protein [Vicinamibacterales bacterium]
MRARCIFVTGSLALVLLVTSRTVSAQDDPALTSPLNDLAAAQSDRSGFSLFMGDVFSDYRNMLTLQNLELAAVGGDISLVVHHWDDNLTVEPGHHASALKPGNVFGSLAFQFPLATAWWLTGHLTGSERGADAGRDLLRAQISAVSWTYAAKYMVNRTRPNGDPRSFPSGHASATFATATVLEQHYGWKVGVPMYALATYTAFERVHDRKHWPSDVTFGATVGFISARTVTLHVRKSRVAVQPQPIPGGLAIGGTIDVWR